jgi:hypothetical protein
MTNDLGGLNRPRLRSPGDRVVTGVRVVTDRTTTRVSEQRTGDPVSVPVCTAVRRRSAVRVEDCKMKKNQENKGFLLVPAERIELPTFGLQNPWPQVLSLARRLEETCISPYLFFLYFFLSTKVMVYQADRRIA